MTETAIVADAPAAAAPSWSEIGDRIRRHVETAGETITPVVIAEADNPDLWDEEPNNPQRLARLYLESVSPADGPLRLRFWLGDFHEWRDGRYHAIDTEAMKNRVRTYIADELQRVYTLRMKVFKTQADQKPKRPKVDRLTEPLVRDVVNFLGALCSGETDGISSLPTWLGAASGDQPPAREFFVFPNGLLHAPTGQWIDPTPEFFNLAVLDFEYDAQAPVPAEWLKFLRSVWPDDRASIDCLQEWFGYLLTNDNRYQKGLWIKGMSRGGKGVIFQALRDMLGDASVACPTLRQIGEQYGLHVLVDSPVGWMDEPKIGKQDNVPAIVGNIKRITGGSPVDVERKHKSTLKGVRLPTRFVVTSNELIQLDDASGVVANRFIVLSVPVSHSGSEDTGLGDRIRAELSGILLWALAGLRRLHARGRFLQPATGQGELDQLRDLASPISQFIGDRLIVDPDADVFTPAALVFTTWREWCAANGETAGSANVLSAKLNSILPAACRGRQGRIDGQKMRYFPGVRLRGNHEGDDVTPVSDQPEGDRDTHRDTHTKEEREKDGASQDLLNDCSPSSVPINPVSRSDASDRDTESHCQSSTYHAVSRCPDEVAGKSYSGESPAESAHSGGTRYTPSQVQPAMGNHRDIGTPDTPDDLPEAISGSLSDPADLTRLRTAFARRLRAAGLTWDAIRDHTDEWLPVRLDDALAKDLESAAEVLANLAPQPGDHEP